MEVEIGEDGFVVDAEVLAGAFGIEAPDVQMYMQTGIITSLCERGVDADKGRWRLTFYHGDRALRLTVDGLGNILARSTFGRPGRQPASPK